MEIAFKLATNIGEVAMPNRLPIKPHAKAIRARKPARTDEQAGPTDWLGLWAVSLAVAASVLAWIAFFTIGDNAGASFILGGTAALIALLLTVNERGYL
jgi:hypothetical protein